MPAELKNMAVMNADARGNSKTARPTGMTTELPETCVRGLTREVAPKFRVLSAASGRVDFELDIHKDHTVNWHISLRAGVGGVFIFISSAAHTS